MLKTTTAATLLLLVLATACPRPAPAPAPPAAQDAGPVHRVEVEPNDRPDQSMAIGESTLVAGSLEADPARPDEDWYLLFTDHPRLVDIQMSGIPGTEVVLEVFDVARNRLAVINGSGEGRPTRLPNLSVKDKLLLKVSAARRGSGGAYTLSLLFSEPVAGAEAEPNDRAADATEVTSTPEGQGPWVVKGLLSHPSDEDYFRLVLAPPETADAGPGLTDAGPTAEPALAETTAVDAGGLPASAEVPRLPLRISLSAVPGVRFEVQVLSEAQAQLFVGRGQEGLPFDQRNVAVRASDNVVYLVVRSAWTGAGKESHRGSNAEVPYTLTVSREAAGVNSEYEPNDDMAHATPLPVNGYREGFLSPKGDVDYYVLRVPQPSLARFELTGLDRVDLVLSVVAPGDKPGTEKVLLKSNDGAVKEPERLNSVACASECFVKVEGAPRKVDGKWVRDFENADQPYRLTVTTTPDTGAEEREPNDSAETATPVSPGKPIRGTIYPKRDVDFYRLDLGDRQVKTPLRATLTGILKVDVALYLYRQEADGSLTLVQTADRAKGDAPEVIRYAAEPGTYFLKVQDSKKRESNFQDSYQLTVEESD
ncbi:MAG: ABC transporter substrate-binding protein [Myxococcaceae bacterium]